MRKTMKRFLTAVLSALAFVAVGFGVGALKTVDVAKASVDVSKLVIEQKSLNVSDNVNIVFYVPVGAGDKNDIKVNVTENGTDFEVSAAATDYKVGEEAVYYRYVYRGISAYEIDTPVYAYAYSASNPSLKSETMKYSVLQYAYSKLGKADGTADASLGNLLTAMLSYGSAAAQYSGNDLNFADDYVYVSVANAMFADGFSHGVFKKGTQQTLTIAEDYKLSINANTILEDNGDGTVTFTIPNSKLIDTESFVHKDTVEEQEATVLATFEFGENGDATHKDGSNAKTTYTEENNGYTLSITEGVHMYPSSYDDKGNSCIKFGTSSAVGSCTIAVPEDVTEVVLYVAKYKANTSKISINGGEIVTLTSSSSNGEYDEITVDTTTTKTISFTTVSGGVRAMLNTIVFKGMPLTEQEKVDKEIENLNAYDIPAITATGAVQLPISGTTHTDVAITWTMGDYSFATLDGATGLLTVNELPAESTSIVLTATVTFGDAAESTTKEIAVNVVAVADKFSEVRSELNALFATWDENVDGNSTIENLPTHGTAYEDVTIVWSVESGAEIENNTVVTFDNPTSDTATVILKATLSCGDVTDSEPVTKEFIVAHVEEGGKTYSYTFSSTQFSANGTKTLNDVSWTVAGDGGYWGYDATKGQQLGSGSKPYKSLTVTSAIFNNVSKIVINTSGASSINGSFTVWVNGQQVGTSTKLESTANSYTFDVENLTGAVEFKFTQTSSKALYIKSITVEYAE